MGFRFKPSIVHDLFGIHNPSLGVIDWISELKELAKGLKFGIRVTRLKS